jgi:hypothetical protein
MMPHLGVLSSVHPDAAQEIFERDCLVYLGTSISPVWKKLKPGTPLLNYELGGPVKQSGTVNAGDLLRIPLAVGETVEAELQPAHRSVDVGDGPGKTVQAKLRGGHAGLIFDGRGRPLALPETAAERATANHRWMSAFGLELPTER